MAVNTLRAPEPEPIPISPAPYTPEWWLMRLLRQLEYRMPLLATWNDYYEGRQPLAFASTKFREAFGERFPAFTSNFCSLVVDGTSERLEVAGFRFADESGDADLWELWQQNDMDAGSQLAHVEALIKGDAYALVEPNGAGAPLITVEDAMDTIVECNPKNRRERLAGLKRWVDESTGNLVAVVYLPDGIYKYRTQKPWATYSRWWWTPAAELEPGEFTDWRLWQAAGFERWQPPDDADWPLPNPTGVVPLVQLSNRPRLRGWNGVSEIQPIRSNQDAVNKYRCDALIASEFAAFPQRYLLNYEPEVDPDTGRAKAPFQAAIDRLWTVPPPDPELEGAPEPKFGQFAAASLEPYERMIGLEVGHIAAISRMPWHELFAGPQSVPPSGESLKSSEAGLEHKCSRARLFLGNGWEEVMRVALLAQSDARGKDRSATTLWSDTETRNEAVRTDSIVKLHAEGIIDDELAWEMAGLTPEQTRRLRARREAEAAAAPPPPPPPPAGPPEVVPAPTGPRMGPGAV